MSDSCCKNHSKRKEIRNISITDLPTYRLPPAGIVSILHRISGLLLFIFLPFLVWLLATTLTSSISYAHFSLFFSQGMGFDPVTQTRWLPGWLMKILALVLTWSFLHHFCAGVRHLYMDMTHKASKEFGRSSALTVLVISLVLTIVLALKIFGVY